MRVLGLKLNVVVGVGMIRRTPRGCVGCYDHLARHSGRYYLVAPRAGAWVETVLALVVYYHATSRTPCGCVG